MFDILRDILINSELISIFSLKKEDDLTSLDSPHVSYRVKPNLYRIRAFELWGNKDDFIFRVYHSKIINSSLKNSILELDGKVYKNRHAIDFKCNDYIELARKIRNILLSSQIIEECKADSPRAKTSKFEGLDLPDIDTSQDDAIGQTFTWRDIISIWEDNSEDNLLKKQLSQNGIYIQRSKDGKSRYVGSAYGQDGIIGRWMKHLNSNGDAQHLNLFILENGYNEIVFSVLEFYDKDDIIKKESAWKNILGTVNTDSYNGIQLNRN